MINKDTHNEIRMLLNNGVNNHAHKVEYNLSENSERIILKSIQEEKYISAVDNTISQIFDTLIEAKQWLENN